jgi:hypothetical protein
MKYYSVVNLTALQRRLPALGVLQWLQPNLAKLRASNPMNGFGSKLWGLKKDGCWRRAADEARLGTT